LLAALDGVECPADDVTAFVASEYGLTAPRKKRRRCLRR
jgi:hypothetical protein